MERISSFTVNHDVSLARDCCAFYAALLERWTPEKLTYPE